MYVVRIENKNIFIYSDKTLYPGVVCVVNSELVGLVPETKCHS
jgi:hypothetical protein